MKLSRLLFLAALAASAAQTPSPAAPDSQATLRYIHAAWDSLTRSVTDCAAMTDTKVAAVSVLYLPAGFAAPPEVTAAAERCHVRVIPLPRHILKLGDVRPEELAAPGLLYLPHPYVVPGGRFNEMYGWDSFFIVLGLESDHREALAKGIVDNFLFEVEHYGAVLNANRTYYLTRSQPPFLTSMIRLVFEDPASFPATPAGRTQAIDWLEHAYTVAEKDYSTWTRPEHLAGHTGLARYFDYGSGPVPEMADANTYYRDVIRALVDASQSRGRGFSRQRLGDIPMRQKRRASSRPVATCMPACCARAPGLAATGSAATFTWAIAPCANRASIPATASAPSPAPRITTRRCASTACSTATSATWRTSRISWASRRTLSAGIAAPTRGPPPSARYLWQPKQGVFADFDFVRNKPSTYAYLTSLYPLWAGVATREQANATEQKLNVFERPGGLSMSTTNSGLQWDEPCGWAPTNWIAVAGLDVMGFHADAVRIARHFDATVDAGFAADGTIREKYNVVTGNADVTVKGGYTQNVIGFGWTNAVYLKFREIVERPAPIPAEQPTSGPSPAALPPAG